VVKGDKALQDKLPKVMQDAIKAKSSTPAPKGSRSYSTSTTSITGGGELDMGLVDFSPPATAPVEVGTKFGLPALPLTQGSHVKHRYDAVIDQVTNLLMRHGEKSVAQRVRSQRRYEA
jgi:small subunit ribosomal protein S7